MTTPTPPIDWHAYALAQAAVHGIVLDEARLAEVIVQLQRIHAMAQSFLHHPLDDAVEPAPVYRP